jgi:bifunctional DNase/RNase
MARDQRDNPVVLLKSSESDDVLPIWIGHAEGVAIQLSMSGEKFERPLTHDLLRITIESLGASLAKVAVTELSSNTFFAKLYLQRDDDVIVIDARPSDSVALALKFGAPIFVAGSRTCSPASFCCAGRPI